MYFDEIGGSASSLTGFGPRYRLIVNALRERFDTRLFRMLLGDYPPDPAQRAGDVSFKVSARVGRGDRLRAFVSSYMPMRPRPWETTASRVLAEFKPDAVICFAWTNRSLFRWAALPDATTLWFVEEDVAPALDLPMRPTRRALARIERKAEDRIVRGGAIAVISPRELGWARSQFAPGRVEVVPHAVDRGYWAERQHASVAAERFVLVVGQFAYERNAAGLCAIAGEIARSRHDIRLYVASASGLHPCLDMAPPDVLVPLGNVGDLRPFYRSATACLVSSFIVSGVKTTILQAWASSCPVVATGAAAASVGGVHGYDLLAGDTPAEIVGYLELVLSQDSLRSTLAENGYATLRGRFDEASVGPLVIEYLASLGVE